MIEAKPNAELARRIARDFSGCEVAAIARFPTGICHYVYDVLLEDGRALVARLTTAQRRRDFAGALYWYERLLPLGIPLAKILYSDLEAETPVMLLERLPGTDLGKVYASLSSREKREVARHVAEIQMRVGTLPEARGFGWAISYDDPNLRADGFSPGYWHTELADTKEKIIELGHCDSSFVDRVQALLPSFADYFSSLRPRPCLEDTTTKNVLVDRGVFTGIVDVDCVLFGDVLSGVGLTQMSLLGSGYDTDYIEYWCDFMEVDRPRRRVVDCYSAIVGTAFMAEIGQVFNKEKAEVDSQKVERLQNALDALLVRLDV